MTTPQEVVGPNVERCGREPTMKEWHRPELRKLPIVATSGDLHVGGNDGNGMKDGSSSHNS
jgi:hypothetical protein